ncbi:MAG: hypothetical protein RI894_2659, partial [Bacteroidota bacterium]
MELNTYAIASGEKTATLLSSNDVKGGWADYKLSADESKILYSQDEEQLYRHSSMANFFIYDLKSKTVKALSGGGKQRLATFSPTMDKIAFVRDNNLFYKDLAADNEVQLTTDGKRNAIINGAADWVYEEEFSMDRAFYWSPDGKTIAFLRFDESEVKEFTLTEYNGGLYPEWSKFKYPKAGERNAIVTAAMIEVSTKKITPIELPDTKGDYYIPKIQWTKSAAQLAVFVMNRHQNDLRVFTSDLAGKCTPLFNEKSETYIDIAPGVDVADNMKFTEDGKTFFWLSERDGYNHLYMYDMAGKATQITKGKWGVTKVYGVDEKNGVVYYQSCEAAPEQRHIYSIGLNGKNKKQISTEKGWNDAEFSKTFDYYVLSHSTANSPKTVAVYDNKNKKLRDVQTNASLYATMKNYDLAKVEFFKFKTEEDIELCAWMMKPTDFDPKKKYPVLMHVYGGPNNQQVTDNWNPFDYWWYQMLAQQGYIVVTVDGRGTGGRGTEFKTCTYKQLGNLEVKDQIEGAKWLGKQAYVDKTRIGIWGWSFGGYMSLLCILKGNDVFKTAIAVAPVTNWKWYDSIYTERFLTTPEENKAGYEDNSPINFADRLKGNLLLIHGDADDNVHYQNSAEMANALIEANKQYDTYVYTNRDHGISGGNARLHLYTKLTNFILQKL